MAKSPEAINLLLISDAPQRAALVRDILGATRPNCRLHSIGAGHSCLTYLKQEPPFEKAPRNDMILFDLVEPTSSDLRLLERIKADRKLGAIPIVLLTTEESEEVIAVLTDNRRNQIMFSSIELPRFLETMGSIKRDRFLSALQLIENLGYIPVRIPRPAENVASRAVG